MPSGAVQTLSPSPLPLSLPLPLPLPLRRCDADQPRWSLLPARSPYPVPAFCRTLFPSLLALSVCLSVSVALAPPPVFSLPFRTSHIDCQLLFAPEKAEKKSPLHSHPPHLPAKQLITTFLHLHLPSPILKFLPFLPHFISSSPSSSSSTSSSSSLLHPFDNPRHLQRSTVRSHLSVCQKSSKLSILNLNSPLDFLSYYTPPRKRIPSTPPSRWSSTLLQSPRLLRAWRARGQLAELHEPPCFSPKSASHHHANISYLRTASLSRRSVS